MFRRLDEELAQLERQTATVGCVVLRANGRAFCSGADLGAMSVNPPPPTFKPSVIERLSRLPQPVIASVHATCVTGGLELALAADFIFAGGSARFADTHGKWGMVAGWGMTQRLPRRVGLSNAKMMMMSGRFIGAAEALRIGLVDACWSDNELQQATEALARDILANSWHTTQKTKQLLIETEGLRLAEGLAHEHFRYPGLAPDFQERLARFGRKAGPRSADDAHPTLESDMVGKDRTANATLTYIAPSDEPLYNYYLMDPPPGRSASNEVPDPHDVIIRNMREEDCRLDTQGFELVSFKPSIKRTYQLC